MRHACIAGLVCTLLGSPLWGQQAHAAEPRIDIDNALESCVAVAPAGLFFVGQTVLLRTEWAWRKPISECGCKSTLINYAASTANHQIIAAGVLSVVGKREFSFVVNPDGSVSHRLPFKLSIGCAVESGVSL